MFQVFECTHKDGIWTETPADGIWTETPADVTGYPTLKSAIWAQSKYATFEEAEAYANKWLGAYATDETLKLVLDERYEFSGYGDYIVIREVEDGD
jgi:cation diffusion facilitator CzcD-associated flavoprotein CzcO